MSTSQGTNMLAQPEPGDLTKGIKQLSVSRKAGQKGPAQEPIVDSWEDEIASTDSEDDAPSVERFTETPVEHSEGTHIEQSVSSPPSVRPQVIFGPDGTPLSPSPTSGTSAPPNTPRPETDSGGKRPEKTMATASRMIAGALGVRTPKKTEEQKQYDKAVREKETRRREDERERRKREESERERLKKEAWDG